MIQTNERIIKSTVNAIPNPYSCRAETLPLSFGQYRYLCFLIDMKQRYSIHLERSSPFVFACRLPSTRRSQRVGLRPRENQSTFARRASSTPPSLDRCQHPPHSQSQPPASPEQRPPQLRRLERGLQDHLVRKELRSHPRPQPPSTPVGWQAAPVTRVHGAHSPSIRSDSPSP